MSLLGDEYSLCLERGTACNAGVSFPQNVFVVSIGRHLLMFKTFFFPLQGYCINLKEYITPVQNLHFNISVCFAGVQTLGIHHVLKIFRAQFTEFNRAFGPPINGICRVIVPVGIGGPFWSSGLIVVYADYSMVGLSVETIFGSPPAPLPRRTQLAS